ncbi:hypothetical protein BST86_08910 [Nonlabens agnitus]|uniref:Vitellogenin II n=2 Tax=Nonlabens agnitus TaxID=870484 RepID=A0A2S9WUR4_9FLAO|nr:hypothetical protein BST86_08910 [Nonlabens agnitus]
MLLKIHTMKTNTTFKNAATKVFGLGLAIAFLTSCGSYTDSSYNDGIYGGTVINQEEEVLSDTYEQNSSNYYQQLFALEASQYSGGAEDEIFIDVENYSDQGYDQENGEYVLDYAAQPAWGTNPSETIINFYGNPGFGLGFGYPFGFGFNNFGYGRFYGLNNFGYGFGYPFGFGFNHFGFANGSFWGLPFGVSSFGYAIGGPPFGYYDPFFGGFAFNPYVGGFYGNNFYRGNRNNYAYNNRFRSSNSRSVARPASRISNTRSTISRRSSVPTNTTRRSTSTRRSVPTTTRRSTSTTRSSFPTRTASPTRSSSSTRSSSTRSTRPTTTTRSSSPRSSSGSRSSGRSSGSRSSGGRSGGRG